MIQIYTDGAASGNPGPGGYGVVLRSGVYEKELSGGFRLTTNNRMELLAVIEGLKALKNPGQQVTIYSDSKYVVDSVEKGWVFGWVKKAFKDKKNKDLWIQYLALHKIHQIKFIWIKGHNDHPENERCDRLAVAASQNKSQLAIDTFFEAEKKQNNLL
ncbi:MAG: ribonuclease HI [Bacteroidota bacterium]|jgi:ribonuclease HI|uniref:ribonuclease H n=1 Tax=Pedobacter cryotolerans TaxID=2571270 RepID=A0A4U1C623_9SPHI|nr:ribonuclease HI [Pedobacter cryotolerans]RZJ79902.1 MAG: ribonuclease HI [Flavobacterium sp.]TKC00009.1 ribonuclease HI [Pedobacter cryotolerans]